jgi:hypothetical protein
MLSANKKTKAQDDDTLMSPRNSQKKTNYANVVFLESNKKPAKTNREKKVTSSTSNYLNLPRTSNKASV